jgi:glycosyltransferase involved in cell wall biosynthesis
LELTSPKISVLITVYNREKYLSACIESVLIQTFQEYEIIIVDDNSSDSSLEIARKYECIDSRIRVFKNENNIGQFPNRNKAASLASTKYLKYIDSDDKILPSCLKLMYEKIKIYSNFGVLTYLQRNNNKILNEHKYSSFDAYVEHYFLGNTMLFQGPTATIFNKEIFNLVGGFDEDIGILSDTDLMLKIAAVSDVICITEKLYDWRIHDEQVTVGQKDEYRMLKERFDINRKNLSAFEVPFTKKQSDFVLRNIKSIYIRNAIFKFILKFDFLKFISLLKYADITTLDLIYSIFPIRKLSEFKKYCD